MEPNARGTAGARWRGGAEGVVVEREVAEDVVAERAVTGDAVVEREVGEIAPLREERP
jgi:hypothetical protein